MLDLEGLKFFGDLKEKLSSLKSQADLVGDRLNRLDKEIEGGVTCPRCSGTGSIIAEKHYERSAGAVFPVTKMKECALCEGSGKIVFEGTMRSVPYV